VTPAAAVTGVRDLGWASSNMVGYFPRMYQRGDADGGPRAAGGALAGLLCKLDRLYGPWHDLDQQELGFNRDLIAAYDVDENDVHVLSRERLNVIAKGPAGRARLRGSVTMGRGNELHSEFASLPVRRLCLQVIGSIDRATRWAVFEANDSRVAERIRAQVTAHLSALANMGAFESERVVVECDVGPCLRNDKPQRGITILVAFHPLGCRNSVSFTLHQGVSGCRVTTTAFAPVMEYCA
jgi:phage tail sheath protein FI